MSATVSHPFNLSLVDLVQVFPATEIPLVDFMTSRGRRSLLGRVRAVLDDPAVQAEIAAIAPEDRSVRRLQQVVRSLLVERGMAQDIINPLLRQARPLLRDLLEPVPNRPIAPGDVEMTTLALGEEGGDWATTLALGEEGGDCPPNWPPEWGDDTGTTAALGEDGGGWATTLALGEEGGDWPVADDDWATTQALGEEGGDWPVADDDWATTLALGEEGGDCYLNPDEPGMTTQALGEEGGDWPPSPGSDGPTTRAFGEDGWDWDAGVPLKPPVRDDLYTTLAIGEEGGDSDDDLIRYTTLALGEEGGDDTPWSDNPGAVTEAVGEHGDPIIGGSPGTFDTVTPDDTWDTDDSVVTTLALGEEGGVADDGWHDLSADPWYGEPGVAPAGRVNGVGYGDPNPGQF
jgi:hypothetical protein